MEEEVGGGMGSQLQQKDCNNNKQEVTLVSSLQCSE